MVELKEERLRKSLSEAKNHWQGQKDSNPRHAVLETAALPTELYPYIYFCIRLSLPAAGNPSIVFCSIWRDKCVYLLKALFYYTYNLPFCQLLFYIVLQ